MKNAVLVSAVRTPVCKMGGAFKNLDRSDLYTPVIVEALKRAGIEGTEVEENIWGNVHNYATPARYTWLTADQNVGTAGLTMNRGCGTGLTGICIASSLIQNGFGDTYMCGGVEMDSKRFFTLMNESPYNNGKPRLNFQYSSPVKPFGDPNMVQTAENVATLLGITREECDDYAFRSQSLAKIGYEEGLYPEHILPISVPQRKGEPIIVDKDEPYRPDTTREILSKLRPVMGGVCTGGNCSPLNDGAAAGIMMEEEKARAMGLKPLLRFVDMAVVGVDPRYMGLGPVGAMNKLMKRNKMCQDDFDFIELNEAFASQVIGCLKELNFKFDNINIRGGAIALGHPYSATGISLAAKSAGIMKRRKSERCCITFCVGGGQGVAAIFENCD